MSKIKKAVKKLRAKVSAKTSKAKKPSKGKVGAHPRKSGKRNIMGQTRKGAGTPKNAKQNFEQRANKLIEKGRSRGFVTYDEILKELAFDRMVERGLADSKAGKTISDAQLRRRIKTWQS